jgi:hypothetical protein
MAKRRKQRRHVLTEDEAVTALIANVDDFVNQRTRAQCERRGISSGDAIIKKIGTALEVVQKALYDRWRPDLRPDECRDMHVSIQLEVNAILRVCVDMRPVNGQWPGAPHVDRLREYLKRTAVLLNGGTNV